MVKVRSVAETFIRCHYLRYMLGGVLFLLLLPSIVSLENLDMFQSAKVLEYWYSLIGLLLLFPLYLPDNEEEALAIIRSKRTSYSWIVCVRLIIESVYAVFLLILLLIMMKHGHSTFSVAYFLIRGSGAAFFLGGLSALVFAVVRHPVPSLLVPFFYYLVNMMNKEEYFGYVDLFSVAQNSWLSGLTQLLTGCLLFWISISLTKKAKL
ncbi:hypothetical protein I6N96_06845 [Enterococcus sp. BWM-S5]|uniref:ABC transporter permease n=1 Tax=Enterococcus larvae TaxID=2794352 RepID=A0ABS4CHS0_9ENTE|nr:hypothetical protein [Enterococcus larvae]MBP1045994.1 hypothetical protein [Enterococcus larvae]